MTENNNPAIISGINTGNVTEDNDPDRDNLLEAAGKLNVSDSDVGESAFKTSISRGRYGNLRITAAGLWNYTASNDQAKIQALAAGDTLIDTLSISSLDGTSHTVIITINGSNDNPVISGVNTGSVTEDVDPDGDRLLEASGKLNIADRDNGESAFKPGTRGGNYGSLTIDASGNWRYAANNRQAAIQALKNGGSMTEAIKVSSVDGTTRDVRITIRGADDATLISGVDTGNITEDVDPDGDNLLETSGKLNITDADAGDALFVAATKVGLYGELTIDSAGNWRYAASNSLASIQGLNSGASITDTLTVRASSGATRNVVIDISGVDEPTTTSDITISWIAPVEREDGTPISMSEIQGYKVYYGTTQGAYTNQVEISGSANMQAKLRNLSSGTYYIVVTTLDTEGRESAYSTETARTI